MTPLAGHTVLALGDMADSPLARFLGSLGATLAATDADRLAAQIAQASFLIDDLGLPRLAEAGWPRARIETSAPGLVHCSVTSFGSYGPRARWHGGELAAAAMGGVLGLTGTPDRSPVKEALDACTFHAHMTAAAGLLAADHARSVNGEGQHVDISVQEVTFSRLVNSLLIWQFERRKLARIGNALNYGGATVRCIWRLADGWCFHTLMTGRFGAPANRALSDWIDETGIDNPLRDVDWMRYNRSTLDPARRREWEAALEQFFAGRTKGEIAREGRRRGINATVVATPLDVLGDAHLQARDFWRVESRGAEGAADGPEARLPARFLSVHEGTPTDARQPAAPGARPGPLAGIRVLDFSWALVGSITTKILGDLGADIVKVESRTRPCLSRIDVQVSASAPGNFDDKPWFAHLNTSKRSLALDLKRPEARALLDPLIAWADVVVENFSPGTMSKLGLSFETLARQKPGLIMASGSVYGQTGPLASEWGVDGTGAALSGRTYLTGWADRDPVIPGAVPYGDVIVPYVMAAGLCAALAHRRETGVGAHLDASMYEICVQQMYDAIRASQCAAPPERNGNDDPRVFHQGVYPVAGVDRWIAITLRREPDWARLRALAQLPEAGGDAQRRSIIGAWTSRHTGSSLMASLQEAGIVAGVVQDIEDLVEGDPQIAARGTLIPIVHPLLGTFGHMRTPMSFSRSATAPYRAPGIGEHSLEIAGTICGVDAAQAATLAAAGVFT